MRWIINTIGIFLLYQSFLFAEYRGNNYCSDLKISDFSYFSLDKTHYGVDTKNHDNEFINKKEDWFMKRLDYRTVVKHKFKDTEKKNLITHMLFHPTYEKSISIEEDNRVPLIVLHGIDVDKDVDPLKKADIDNLCASVKKQKHYMMNTKESYFSVLNGLLSKKYITDKYRIYYYSYASHKHITFSARMLSNLLYEDKYIQQWVKNNGKLSFLAHSMGGLVARSMLEEHNGIWYEENGSWKNIETNKILGQLITLATPHHGSPATSSAWFDTPDSISKNRNNPASQDMYWDNYDNIYFVKNAHYDIFDLRSRNYTLGKDYIDCDKPHTFDYELVEKEDWYDDSQETRYEFMKDFDQNYTNRLISNHNIETFWKSICYQGLFDKVELEVKTPHYPNPWLTYLNKMLDKKDKEYMIKKRYIFYGGINDTANSHTIANIVNDDSSWDPLRIFGADYGAATDFMYKAGYLSDLIVPTTSSIFDTTSQAPNILIEDIDKMIGKEILSFIIAEPLNYLLIKNDTAPKVRFFKDYHHSRMHAGSYRNNPNDMHNRNKAAGILDENVQKNYIKQAFSGEKNDFIDEHFDAIKLLKIEYDPLYIRLALDLGINFNDLKGVDYTIVKKYNLTDIYVNNWFNTEKFRDIVLKEKIINGYPDNTFKADKKIIIIEALKMIYTAISSRTKASVCIDENKYSIPYSSSKNGYENGKRTWYFKSLYYASARFELKNQNVVNSKDRDSYVSFWKESEFQLTKKLTRGEVAHMIANALKLEVKEDYVNTFSDLDKTHKHYRWIMACAHTNADAENKIINGYSDGTFKPDIEVNRAEMSKLVRILYEKLNVEEFMESSRCK